MIENTLEMEKVKFVYIMAHNSESESEGKSLLISNLSTDDLRTQTSDSKLDSHAIM